MELIKKEVKETEYTIKLNQSEMNTITILLGKSTDTMVKEGAEWYRLQNYYTGEKLVDLYTSFLKDN